MSVKSLWGNVKKKKKSHDISRQAKKGIKRTKQLRKLESDRIFFSAKADVAEEKARLKAAKRGGKSRRKKSNRKLQRKLGMRLF